MRHYSAKTLALALAVAGCSVSWAVQAEAQTTASQPTLEQLQQQIEQLQQQVSQMKAEQQNQQSSSASTTNGGGSSASSEASSGPKKSLEIGGGVATEYQVQQHESDPNQRNGGNLILDYFSLNVAGQYGNLTYGAEERWSTTNFADPSFLHYGWVNYAFNDHNSLKGGFFTVPFGFVNDGGYQNFWGNLPYFLGFTDTQAAGLGYEYQNGGLQIDLDAFKNDNLEQNSTYGSVPFNGYQQINGGNGRIGYTFNKGGSNWVDIAASARGGELEVGKPNSAGTRNGTRWAGTLTANAYLGNWILQAQAIDYRYNIPSGQVYEGSVLPTNTIEFENYGFGYIAPAHGQVYAANVAKTFPVKNMGPIDSFQVYDNYSYLHSGVGGYDTRNGRIGTGNSQFNVIGGEMQAGPFYVWADMLLGKNATAAFVGPDDGNWHPRFNLTAAFYFDGKIVK